MRNRTGDRGGFSRSTMRHPDGPSGRTRSNANRSEAAGWMRMLFDQPQQGTSALALRRFRLLRSFRRRLIRQHRIAQGLPLRVRNSIEFPPKLENCHGHKLSSLALAALDENSPAFLEGCENRMQSFF